MKNRGICCAVFFLFLTGAKAQTLSDIQMRNARATGYAIIAAKNPGVMFSVIVIPWDGVNTMEYNANHQINFGWHAQAAIKGNHFTQPFDETDFSSYSSVVISEADFVTYQSTGTQWWIVCSTLSPFSSSITSVDGNIGIGTNAPSNKLTVNGSGAFTESVTAYANGLRPISLSSLGSIYSKGDAGGWAFGYHAKGALGTDRGGFGFLGNADNIEYYYIGQSYMQTSMVVYPGNGNVGIGTLVPSHKLSVNGNIKAKKVIVSQTGWPDYVFSNNYKLRSLKDLSTFIKQQSRLPDMPSAADIQQNGLDIGDQHALLLKKVEELTLYIIDLDKRLDNLVRENKFLFNEIESLSIKYKIINKK